jgi:GT2 family glycosyltransferase
MISFIIVNYKSLPELTRCLSDLEKLPHSDTFEVIVVNNDPEKLPPLTYAFEKCVVCEINENIGYGAANNKGLAMASREYVCFLNPDTYDFDPKLLDILAHIDARTIASPQIRTPDGTPQQWSVGEKITLFQTIKNNFGFYKKLWQNTALQEVYWVSGAALFVQKNLIERLHGFDTDYFLYFEDADLCHRLHDIGGRVLYVPEVRVTHICGGSSKKARKNQKKWYYRSQDIFFRKHCGVLQLYILRALRFFHK